MSDSPNPSTPPEAELATHSESSPTQSEPSPQPSTQPTTAASPLEAAPAPGATPAKPKGDKNFWLWVGGIAVLLAVELFIYGHNGQLEVCVGIEGVTDFSLRGEARTKENQRKLPNCAQRLNLGMYNHAEELASSALKDACGRATMTTKQEMPNCLNRDKKWTRRVTKNQVAPWDPRLYRRLLWLE